MILHAIVHPRFAATTLPPARFGTPGPTLPTAITDRAVLVIEDEAMIAWAVESMLEDMGFQRIRIARDARQALALARDEAPGLIVSDINLGAGVADGIDAVAAIGALGPVAALFVTGHAGDGERARIAEHRLAAPVLLKPVDPDALCRAIAALLGSDGAPH